jgi:glycosyltransferase involved in cell wall biosynthesis
VVAWARTAGIGGSSPQGLFGAWSRRRVGGARRAAGNGLVHVIEPGGSGGIHQHAVQLALESAPHVGPIVVHTRKGDLLDWGAAAVSRCNCFERGTTRGPIASMGHLAVVLMRVLGHLLPAIRVKDVVHVHGTFRGPFTTMIVAACRLRGATVFYSPHNTFARDNSRLSGLALRTSILLSSHVFVYAERDLEVVRGMGKSKVSVIPLVLMIPSDFREQAKKWRASWQGLNRPVILAAGIIRKDKRYDVLIRAVKESGRDVSLVVLGKDGGSAPDYTALASNLGVDVQWCTRYVSLPEFVGAVFASDIVVCPYDRASQSAVLVIARALGVHTIASDVGGLAEIADQTFPAGDSDALAKLIRDAFGNPMVDRLRTPVGVGHGSPAPADRNLQAEQEVRSTPSTRYREFLVALRVGAPD